MHSLVLFISLIFILWIGRSIFIPILFAAFLWYLLNAISTYYRRIMPCGRKASCNIYTSKTFDILSYVLSFASVFGVIYLFATQIRPMLSQLYNATPVLQQRLLVFTQYISQQTGIAFDMSMLPDLTQTATYVGSSLAGIATSTGMVFIYLIFMFIEQSSFGKKINSLQLGKTKEKKLRYILSSIDENMKKYLFTKTFISAATGISAYILLKMIGLEYASVWAVIIFILNYIPTLGSILACALPILYALISGDTWHLALFTAISLIIIETIFGNILDPKLTGKTLNISTLAILINLVFWGMIWGLAGMFFSVPILVAIYITTAQFPSTRWIAVLLSSDGKIPEESD
ncbi:MAG: AI-2E family transporter [Alphaproteobacteria bacterium]|nr:AI-2E family transporter [Alphaproteobacteria bacterium]